MKSKLKYLLIIVLSLILLSSCSGRVYFSGDEYIVLGSYIPGFFDTDMRGIRTDILQKDDFGRILFLYRTNCSEVFPSGTSALVICQKYQAEYVYYYDDMYYLILDRTGLYPKDIDLNDDSIVSFMLQNDWNQELNSDKMTQKHVDIALNMHIDKERPVSLDYSNIRQQVSAKLDLTDDDDLLIYYIESDEVSRTLNWMIVRQKSGEQKHYFLIANREGEASFVEIDNMYVFQPQLSELKKACSWGK